jgi:hypothetical protein
MLHSNSTSGKKEIMRNVRVSIIVLVSLVACEGTPSGRDGGSDAESADAGSADGTLDAVGGDSEAGSDVMTSDAMTSDARTSGDASDSGATAGDGGMSLDAGSELDATQENTDSSSVDSGASESGTTDSAPLDSSSSEDGGIEGGEASMGICPPPDFSGQIPLQCVDTVQSGFACCYPAPAPCIGSDLPCGNYLCDQDDAGAQYCCKPLEFGPVLCNPSGED